ncbi:uncharacterized protein LOC659745 [Tribolium castaneum]|uniref:BTB domain-containing protein n=1 Tax=Tribolium castaneum TaxID=7070 RepID=D6WGC3_TRICA|nr:PREDICTED: uncharacterized protein LOC659745 [Tribolium castaneum]EFA01130.1 hypothetical protein TcasGA2_TC010343 [Tribolium castaneum]|eukprot:XP_971115.1 PREDICTED: uncharacterized protein LOC659745 [Tribolium castaneum]
MDSGLGSDEDRRGRTKEQKQLRNQQLLSGCFIDAASLSDDAEVDQRRTDERRQGALIFQSSIPQFSMLQMAGNEAAPTYPETSTPYNSIVHLEEDASRKSPLGFYVDLNEVPDPPKTPPPATAAKKNIFSMVIDFEGPKKDKPTKLSSSLVSYKKNRQSKQLTLTTRYNGNSSLSSSVSSISSVAGPSRQVEDEKEEVEGQNQMSASSKSSSSSENFPMHKSEDEGHVEEHKPAEDDVVEKKCEETNAKNEEIKEVETQERPQFVKLSDLECQKPRLDLNFTPRMSKSIPESSWVESPLLMSRSAGYRSAPHPLEPESGEFSDSGSATDTSVSQPRRSVRRLGTDLLRMFLEEIGPDVTVEVDGHKLKAHKCILASRCQYFAALLSGNWLEASGNIISLQGFSYESVYFALCHIYSGAAHVPDSISLVELASLADMLGLEGLKEVVEHALKQRHCHNFHKPCAGCCTGVLEVLPLSAAYGLDDLYQKCLQWITQHFVRVWPSRAFASLPRELREKCYQQHVVHMTADKVLETIVSCDKVLATLPALRWAEPVTQLVLQLSDACHLYHRQHFAAVLASPSFLALDAGLGWSVGQVEDQMVSAAGNLSVEQACRSYARCCKMVDQSWSRPFNDLLFKIKVQLEQCLVAQSDRLIRSNAWLRLDSALRCRIKDLTPVAEPVSRLPRATPKRTKKSPLQSATKPHSQSPTISSSDSSRNSSPGMNQAQSRLHNSGGSPSLRRSLLLAARAPQVPPSPSTHRRSTLTQPTQASAAKSAPSKNIRNPPPKAATPTTTVKPAQKKAPARNAVSNPNLRKPNPTLSSKKPISRSSSPLKVESRASSRVTSPIKADVRTPSPKKMHNGKVGSPRKEVKESKESKPVVPTMQRSSTFLKDEPTVLGKVK